MDNFRLEFNSKQQHFHFAQIGESAATAPFWVVIHDSAPTWILYLFTESLNREAKKFKLHEVKRLFANFYALIDSGIIKRSVSKERVHSLLFGDKNECNSAGMTPIEFVDNFCIGQSDDDLYFISMGDFIKIGRSSNVEKRISSMITAMPFAPKILCVWTGGGCHEKKMHNIFEKSRTRTNGEWFYNHKDLMELIKHIKQKDYIDNVDLTKYEFK